MITEQQEQLNHENGAVSSAPLDKNTKFTASLPASLPARSANEDSQRASQTGAVNPHSPIEVASPAWWFAWIQDQVELERLPSTPLLLTRGAHPYVTSTPLPQKTHIDWLSFTANEPTAILFQLAQQVIPEIQVKPLKHGMQGYKYVSELTLHGQTIGRLGYGTSHGRNLFTLTGQGTAQVQDWQLFLYWFDLLNTPRLSRLDIAYDRYNGELNHDLMMTSYNGGLFKSPKSPRNPQIFIQGGTDGNGKNLGRTVTIGNRKSSKFIRCYEKGLERFSKLFGQLPEKDQTENMQGVLLNSITCQDIESNLPDVSILGWYRMEVQFGNSDRILTPDMITNRDLYFAGAYPFCKQVLEMNEESKPDRVPNNLQTDIEIMFGNIKSQYGSFITTMLAMGMKPEEILQKIVNGKLSQRIIKAGGLNQIGYYDPTVLAPQDE